jgi:hypothetical protein
VGFRLLSQVSPSSSILSCLLPVFYFQLYFHRCLGLPAGLVPIGLKSNSFLVGLVWSIHCICPSHIIICALINLNISGPSINLSIFMLFRILHILSILTDQIFSLVFAFQKCVDCFYLLLLIVQVSNEYITSGHIIYLHPHKYGLKICAISTFSGSKTYSTIWNMHN